MPDIDYNTLAYNITNYALVKGDDGTDLHKHIGSLAVCKFYIEFRQALGKLYSPNTFEHITDAQLNSLKNLAVDKLLGLYEQKLIEKEIGYGLRGKTAKGVKNALINERDLDKRIKHVFSTGALPTAALFKSHLKGERLRKREALSSTVSRTGTAAHSEPVTTPERADAAHSEPVITPVGADAALLEPLTTTVGADAALLKPVTTIVGADAVHPKPVITHPVPPVSSVENFETTISGGAPALVKEETPSEKEKAPAIALQQLLDRLQRLHAIEKDYYINIKKTIQPKWEGLLSVEEKLARLKSISEITDEEYQTDMANVFKRLKDIPANMMMRIESKYSSFQCVRMTKEEYSDEVKFNANAEAFDDSARVVCKNFSGEKALKSDYLLPDEVVVATKQIKIQSGRDITLRLVQDVNGIRDETPPALYQQPGFFDFGKRKQISEKDDQESALQMAVMLLSNVDKRNPTIKLSGSDPEQIQRVHSALLMLKNAHKDFEKLQIFSSAPYPRKSRLLVNLFLAPIVYGLPLDDLTFLDRVRYYDKKLDKIKEAVVHEKNDLSDLRQVKNNQIDEACLNPEPEKPKHS